MKKVVLLFFGVVFVLNVEAWAKMPAFEKLPSYWQTYFTEVDQRVKFNFFANLFEYSNAQRLGDPYISQLEKMGYIFQFPQAKPAPFFDSMNWVIEQIEQAEAAKEVGTDEVLKPARAFEKDGQVIFVEFGNPVPEGVTELNLLQPDVFSKMLKTGFFPVGEATLAKTNQTLAEHDLAHLASFAASPWYMKAVRKAFAKVDEKMQASPRVAKALQNFDSLYSLRLYYMIEVFTLIRESQKETVAALLRFPKAKMSLEEVRRFLLEMYERDPVEMARYLSEIYVLLPSALNPLGGESRDIMNRTRKFDKESQVGNVYGKYSQLSSKFNGSSIYSMYLNATKALQFGRDDQDRFRELITDIHAPLLLAIHGMLDLKVDDWVDYAVEEVIDRAHPIYRNLCESGIWNRNHVIYWAYCEPQYDLILNGEMMK